MTSGFLFEIISCFEALGGLTFMILCVKIMNRYFKKSNIFNLGGMKMTGISLVIIAVSIILCSLLGYFLDFWQAFIAFTFLAIVHLFINFYKEWFTIEKFFREYIILLLFVLLGSYLSSW